MARRNYNGYGGNRNRKRRRRKSRYTEQEKFAFRLGQVTRGLKNPDSRITESYVNGEKVREKKSPKSLY